MTFQSCQNSANKDPRLFSALFLSVPLLFASACGGGGGGSTPPVSPTITSVSVSCTPVSVQTGQTSQCTATVSGTGSYSSAVTWSAVSGTISSSGLYTAPASVPASGSDTITAKSTQDSTKFGTSLMTVTAAPPTINSVSVSCTPTSVQTGQTSQCTATVSGTGSYSSAVTWSAVSGTISSSGLYTAPASVPASGSDTITAKSTQDSTKFGTSMMTVTAAPPTINSVSVSCTPTSVQTGQTSQCTATVSGTGSYSSAVTWSAVSGTISNLGLYTAPVTVPNLGSDTITATSTQDITKSGSASLAVTTPNPMQHGALVISPPLYASGVSTSMTVSIWIPDHNLDTKSVTGYETEKNGVPISSKGLLNDSGINGDVTAGDNVYTLQFAVDDASPTTHYYAVSYKSLSTGATYSTEVDTTTSVPTVSVSDSPSYSQNIKDSMNRLINAVSSYQAIQPTTSTPINQTAAYSYLSTMVSVMGNIQQLSSYDSTNPLASHVYMSGEHPALAPLSTPSSSFWDFLASAFGLGDIVQTGNSLLSEKAAFLSPSFNPNDPAVAGVMAWLTENPDYEVTCSPDLVNDTTGCRALIWTYFSQSPSAGLLVAAAKTATTAGISEGTGLAEDGTGDLISNQADLSPVATWALGQGIGAGTDYFVDNYVSSSGRQMLIFGNVSSGQTTALPNGSHNIILASGTSETQPTGFPVPTITTLAPSSLTVGASPQTLTINGTDLLSSSTVTFNGTVHTPTYVSANQITISLTSSDLAVSGSYPVVVANPGAIGTLSAAAAFWVTTGPTTNTVPVGNNPTALVVNPETNRIYVANYGSNNITVINGTDNSTATIPLAYAPWAIAINTVTNKVYVAGGSAVTVIDGVTNSTTSIPLSATATSGGLTGIAVNSLTNTIYVVDYEDDATIINGSDFSTTTLTGLGGPGFIYPYIVVNPVTNQIYVPYVASGGNVGNVTIIDGVTLAKTTVTVGKNPEGIAFNSLTNQIYVANYWSGDVTVIKGADYSTSTIPGGGDDVAIAVNPISNMVYLANASGCAAYCSGGFTVISGSNNSTSTTIPSSSLKAVAINSTTNKVYFTNPGYAPGYAPPIDTIVVLDGVTNTTTSVTVGSQPSAIAVNQVTNTVYVTNSGSNDVTVIGPQ